ncbi:MAG: phosphatidylserine decarboxylase [Clostridiales bacterium]|nr:phosphatidylserine decarboxylase [Clostridiales bacterium]
MFEDIYSSVPGRALSALLARPFISKAAGKLLDSRLSAPFVRPFVKKHDIDLSQAEQLKYKSFNAFFTRRLKKGAREVSSDASALVSPCDGLLSAYDIGENSAFPVKGRTYTVKQLLKDETLEQQFAGGKCLVFRLTPTDYHRYIFPCEGSVVRFGRIPGVYHTVRPNALKNKDVFYENTREWTLMDTPVFGRVLMMEVGALLVGRITNIVKDGAFTRWQEKGYFEFGGSTIVLLLQKDACAFTLRPDTDAEIPVRQGQLIGFKQR